MRLNQWHEYLGKTEYLLDNNVGQDFNWFYSLGFDWVVKC